MKIEVLKTIHLDAGFQIAPNWPWSRKMTMPSQFAAITSSSIFWRCFVSLVKFSYWPKFHVNIITGSGLWHFFSQGIDQKPGNRKYPGQSFVQYLETGWVRDIKLSTDISNEILLNTTKCQGYILDYFWVIKGKPTGVEVKLPTNLPPTQIRVDFMKIIYFILFLITFFIN